MQTADTIRARRDALLAQQAQVQQQDAELDLALARVSDLPVARAVLMQVQSMCHRELDAMYGGLRELDSLLAE